MNDRCKGCFMKRLENDPLCFFLNYKLVEKCPCGECLVKIICNTACINRDERKEEICNELLEGENK